MEDIQQSGLLHQIVTYEATRKNLNLLILEPHLVADHSSLFVVGFSQPGSWLGTENVISCVMRCGEVG